MNVQPVVTAERFSIAGPSSHPNGRAFGDLLADALDGTAGAVAHADGLAGAVALGKGSVIDASVARAKADVLLEIVAVAASRISTAVNSLLQTQV
jgi:flagellar hook-basal body complex protein FliE